VLATPLMILAVKNAALNVIRYLEPRETALDTMVDTAWQSASMLKATRDSRLKSPWHLSL
jgi:predicted thioesterase